MKALTLHQPWASLIALGVKTIETRSWSTKYRGPLAIHAGVRWPALMHLPPLRHTRDLAKRAEVDEHNGRTWLVINTITDPAFQGLQPQGKRIPRRALTPTLFWPHRGPHARLVGEPDHLGHRHSHTEHLPFGAVVATCNLVDVIRTDRLRFVPDGGIAGRSWGLGVECGAAIESEQPFGDYSPGRFAWLLADITPIAPVAAKGKQGLWTWDPSS